MGPGLRSEGGPVTSSSPRVGRCARGHHPVRGRFAGTRARVGTVHRGRRGRPWAPT